MDKLDLMKLHKQEYRAKPTPAQVIIGPAKYLAIEGQGAPGSDVFVAAIGALYGMAFTIKMTYKFAGRGDYVVGKLSGRYWSDEVDDLTAKAKELWQWDLMIRVPDFIGEAEREDAIAKLHAKGKTEPFERVRLIDLDEGPCVQMLHVGPYETEPESIAQMHRYAAEQGLSFHMRHHEIYLNDPRRIPPERLKTILRHPVRRKGIGSRE